jgi:hypothetical protein
MARSLFLYFTGILPLDEEHGRDEIEDVCAEVLGGDDGVTGGGGGLGWSNVDMEVFDADRSDEVLARLRRALRSTVSTRCLLGMGVPGCEDLRTRAGPTLTAPDYRTRPRSPDPKRGKQRPASEQIAGFTLAAPGAVKLLAGRVIPTVDSVRLTLG